MPKCSDCGFWAVWIRTERKFEEASDYFREYGRPERMVDHEEKFHAKCFIRKNDLIYEYWNGPRTPAIENHLHSSGVKDVIHNERVCDGFMEWSQGFSPREHLEMVKEERRLSEQRRHEERTLRVAVFGALAATIGVLLSAVIGYYSANLGADAARESAKRQVEALREQTTAQLEMAKMQVNAQMESTRIQIDASKNAQAPNITVRTPSGPTK